MFMNVILVCTMYIHVHECILMYVPGTYIYMDVYICMYTVQTRLFSFTSTLHFPSGPISRSLATPASLSSAQAPLLQSCIPPVICFLT